MHHLHIKRYLEQFNSIVHEVRAKEPIARRATYNVDSNGVAARNYIWNKRVNGAFYRVRAKLPSVPLGIAKS